MASQADPSTAQVGSDGLTVGKWVVAAMGLWAVLAILAEIDDSRELAVALAWVATLGVLMYHGPKALQNLGLTQPITGGTNGRS